MRVTPAQRLSRICAQVASSDDDDEELAFERYCEEGERKAMTLGNRGPIRYDSDGDLAKDILDAYWRCGFYVFENAISADELSELQTDFEALLDNAPVSKGSSVDKYGIPVEQPHVYVFGAPLVDPLGGGDLAADNFRGGETKGRNQMKMREPPPPEAAPAQVLQGINLPLVCLTSFLRAYAHPDLLRIVESINGPDFTPFTESLFYKPASLGQSTAWHQDPSNAWDEAWSKPDFDTGTVGFNMHISLYNCTAKNGLWMIPGSDRGGRKDIKAWSARSGGSDRLVGAVPVICGPGDVYLQNRTPLHGAFANTSPDTRATLQMGFHRRSSVLGVRSRGYVGIGIEADAVDYTEEYIRERSKMVMLAIDARRQRYPNEKPYDYLPFKGEEKDFVWHPRLKMDNYGNYYFRHLVI